MRLLLDEHYSPLIAEELRELGHDVMAVAQSDLAGLRDRPLMAEAIERGRALVTENVGDFVLIAAELARLGVHHFGIIATNARRFPRSRDGTGRLVAALDALLVALQDHDALGDRVVWLAPTDEP